MAGQELAHPDEHAVEHAEGAEHHEPVVAPDQLKPPPFRKLTMLAAVVTIIALPIVAVVGNHEGNVEKVFLIGIAGVMLLMIIIDAVLRKAGLKN